MVTSNQGAHALLTESSKQLAPACVLVVDDDSGVRSVVARALQDAGYAALTAGNGGEALELLEHSRNAIDLVITDIRMPRLGGIELGREISAREWAIPVVYMSADPSEAPGVHCLCKPFPLATLLATVGQLVAW